MTHDDELRSRMNRMADEASIPELDVESVQARGHRRSRNQRILAVAAAFFLLVGAAGVVRSLVVDDDPTLDVATETIDDPANTDDGADGATDGDDADSTTSSRDSVPTTIAPEALGFGADAAVGSFYGGANWVLPWSDGFVAFTSVWEPSDQSMEDLVPDIRDRFPQEILDALAAAGLDVGAGIEESSEALAEAGLLDLATEIVTNDPELLDAYMQVSSGTYRLEVQASSDGVNWSVVPDFTFPGGSENMGFVQSDGRHLIVTNQRWDEGGGTSEIEVWFTADLTEWTPVNVPIDEPADVPAGATVNTNLSSVAVGPDGFYLITETYHWVDFWSLLPQEVLNEAEQNGWGWTPSAEGLRLESYDYSEVAEPVMPTTTTVPPAEGEDSTVDDAIDEVAPPLPVEWEPTLERLIPWSELGIDYDEYADYIDGPSRSSGWIGDWSGNLAPASVPAPTACCQVIGTAAGYLAMAWGYGEHGFEEFGPHGEGGSNSLHFSPDGQSWTEIQAPSDSGWLDGMYRVGGAVLFTTSGEENQQIWRANPDGTEWQSVTIPGLPADTWVWFGSSGPFGVAATIDTATYEWEEPPPLIGLEGEFEVDGHVARYSVGEDGFAQITIVDPDGVVLFDEPSDWPVTYGGDIIEMFYVAASELAEESETNLTENMDEVEMIYDTLWASEQEIRAEQGWVEPTYVPDMWLIASADGIDWLVQDLEDVEEGWYSAVGISGSTIALQGPNGWVAAQLN